MGEVEIASVEDESICDYVMNYAFEQVFAISFRGVLD